MTVSPVLASLLGPGDWDHKTVTGNELVHRLLALGHLKLHVHKSSMTPRERWQSMLKPAVKMGLVEKDPWADMKVHEIRTELVTRWDYDAATQKWTTTETLVKVEQDHPNQTKKRLSRKHAPSLTQTGPSLPQTRHSDACSLVVCGSDGARALCARRDARVLPDEEDVAGEPRPLLQHELGPLQQLRGQALPQGGDGARLLLRRHQDADGGR